MTKRYFMMAVLLAATTIAMGQNTYLNDQLTATDDIDGTARYVGMGGAMGALGADLSVISSNPAGIGLYRKNDIGLTFGAVVPNKAGGWNSDDSRAYGEKLARASFDQAGIVWSIKTGGKKLKFVNFAFNYQKKANYNMGFYADNLALGGLSQMDQMAELATDFYDPDNVQPNLSDLAAKEGFLTYDEGNDVFYNNYGGECGYYTRHQRGSLQAYDFNVSFNVNDRFYTGLTIGADNMNYLSWSSYYEQSQDDQGNYGDYDLYNDREIDGHGVNVKWGFIVRPVETSPFRIGLAIETPTWYRIKSSTLYDLTDYDGYRTDTKESYLETTIRTPWRARLSMGSTVDKILAWGVEYEFANASKTRMGYPSDGYYDSYKSTEDKAMTQLTKNTLRGQHTLKLGLEIKPTDALALRVGYNFVSSRYKKNPTFDQYQIDSYAMNYQTSTDYMTLGAANIVTFGLGYKYKKFYADLAYKYRAQGAKCYAFDTGFTEGDFGADFPELKGATIEPVDLDLNRHQLMLSLGFKF
ncbi:MAG: hypothetical protein IJ197_02220 [Bacteroidaceae bacterium]|nr:hypothetical protein [Bacteroidaceae bacterium]